MATVQNTGDVGRGVDYPIPAKSSMQSAFHPNGLPSTVIATIAGSVPMQLNRNNRGDDCIRVYNPNARTVRVKLGLDNTVVATAADKAIAPGTIETFSMSPRIQWIAVFDTAVGTFEASCGRGV